VNAGRDAGHEARTLECRALSGQMQSARLRFHVHQRRVGVHSISTLDPIFA
jgi:hypothetical protein